MSQVNCCGNWVLFEGKWYSAEQLLQQQQHWCYTVLGPCHIHSFIHSFPALSLQLHEALSAGMRTGGLPLFRAPLQSAFLLILKSCCTVNLFQSRHLFKWIWLENIIQASPVLFLFFFPLLHLFEGTPVLVFSVKRSASFRPERDRLILIEERSSCSAEDIFPII